MTAFPRLRRRIAIPAFVLIGGGAATIALTSGTGANPTPAGATAQATAPYGYTATSLTDCFDDREIPYRQEDTAEGRSVTPIGLDDPATAAAVEECNQLTTRPADAAITDYQNAVSQIIVDCLRDRGYTITTNGNELTDGDGRSVTSWKPAPAALVDDPNYMASQDSCMSYAQSQVANPNPGK